MWEHLIIKSSHTSVAYSPSQICYSSMKTLTTWHIQNFKTVCGKLCLLKCNEVYITFTVSFVCFLYTSFLTNSISLIKFMNLFFRHLIKHLSLRILTNKDEIQETFSLKHAKSKKSHLAPIQ